MKKLSLKYILIFVLTGFLASGKIAAQSISTFSTDLPLLIIDTEGKAIYDEPKITAKMKIISNSSGLNQFTDEPTQYNGFIGIEYRGSSSQNYPQKPFLFETRDVLGKNLNVSLLGLPAENDWILLSNYNDKSLMRNVLGYKLSEKMGHYSPRARLVDVILNNVYQGIYIFTEKIKPDKNRVDIAKLLPENIQGEEITGGYIFKIDYWNNNNSWESPYSSINHPGFKVHFVYHDPDWNELAYEQKEYLKNYVSSFEKALYSANYTDEVQGYSNYIDVKSFIDYFLVSEISRNNDGFKKSCYFHKDKNGKIVAGPVWDFDWAWKNINQCSIFKATDGSGWAYRINDCNPDVYSPDWMVRLFYDQKFKNEVNCRYFDLRRDALSNEHIFGLIDSLYNEVKNAQVKHFQKWQILGKNVGAPEVDSQPTTYGGEVDKLKNWIFTRLHWLDNNMPGTCLSTNFNELPTGQSFHFFPNPSSKFLNIETSGRLKQFSIYNTMGVQVLLENSPDKNFTLDISKLRPGIYILKAFYSDGNSITSKLMKN